MPLSANAAARRRPRRCLFFFFGVAIDSMRCIPPFLLLLLLLQSFFAASLPSISAVDIKVLRVGEELENESLRLNLGKRLYEIHGIEPSASYEVKISYPASIPASFTIQLLKDVPELRLNKNRRLLNTEKLIFGADAYIEELGVIKVYVLVMVEAAGVVAIPGVQERESIIFNIVCDKLAFGIPHKAWWVGIAALLCLLLASVAPSLLPSYFLPNNRSLETSTPATTKSL